MSKQIIYCILLFLLPSIIESPPLKKNCRIYKSESNQMVCSNLTDYSTSVVDELNQYPGRLAISIIIFNNNNLESMPYLCDALPNLEIIHLSYNNIRYLRKKLFSCFKSLRIVWLYQNPLNETMLENLKKELPHVNFTRGETVNSNGERVSQGEVTTEIIFNDTVSTNPVKDHVTVSNTKEENAKATESPNSVGKEASTTKSDSLLVTSTSKTTEENHNSWLIISIVIVFALMGVGGVVVIVYKRYWKRKETENQENSTSVREETENQENSTSVREELSRLLPKAAKSISEFFSGEKLPKLVGFRRK